ncbi:MAG: hypothetical protein RDV48_09830 [Candidatus Eremiobacteraeota bacterium]|nr:hypothetical protein [Candidatus Eremiobacteraeota bacterium]
MSQEVLTEILGRAARDGAFRERLGRELEAILRENNGKLTNEEKQALRASSR